MKKVKRAAVTPSAGLLGAIIALSVLLGCLLLPSHGIAKTPKKTLAAFASETELQQWFKKNSDTLNAYRARQQTERMLQRQGAPMAPVASAPPSPMAAEAESVTNVQTAGVDEGGIVKVHGDHLVMLRRGRLFTVGIGDGRLEPISFIDVFAPGTNPGRAWYDEMLISGDTIIVIGYSYSHGGTEVGLFNIDNQGNLSYGATYVLRSNDYYSSRNYASRLIGNKLIFYTPLRINFSGRDVMNSLPAVKQIEKGRASEFKRIAPARRIYRTDDDFDPSIPLALHSVQVCDIGKATMRCEATGVLGPLGREFYVAGDAVYVWTTPTRPVFDQSARPVSDQPVSSAVFRMPLDGGAPSALKTLGAPVDQFSFLDRNDGYLQVLLRAEGRGGQMWASEIGSQNLALMRVPLSAFNDGTEAAPPDSYRPLPAPSSGSIQNRYIGQYLLYGAGNTWVRSQKQSDQALRAVAFARPTESVFSLPLGHSVDRIEALGDNAVAVGTRGKDLYFTTISLPQQAFSAARPSIAHNYTLKDASQGETRSHGFFYRSTNDNEGIIGLPVRDEATSRQLRETSASVLFLKNNSLRLSELGALAASANVNQDDGCKVSCVDWYGNSRPLFLKNRIFALMGYELVEGVIRNGRMIEVLRVDYSPKQSGWQRER